MLEADNTGSPLEEVETQIPKTEPERLERRHANRSSEVRAPSSPRSKALWFASLSNIKSGQGLPEQETASRLADTPQMAPSLSSLSCDSSTGKQKPSCGAASACVSLLFKFSLREKCEAAKSIPLEMLSD